MEQQSDYGMKRNIIRYEHTGSTNEDARRLALEGAQEGTVVVADSQSAGKGRRGRNWDSPAGCNLYFTLLLKPDFAPDKASMLTLVMALSVIQALEGQTGSEMDFAVKWPNDIVVNGRKLCGILTEMTLNKNVIESLVIGVGVNVNQKEFPKELADTATSLLLEKNHIHAMFNIPDTTVLLNDILKAFDHNYGLFLEHMDLSSLKEPYEAHLANRNKEVRVLEPSGAYEGIALGINEQGELIVRTPDGNIRRIYAGEVSVRGIYGYV